MGINTLSVTTRETCRVSISSRLAALISRFRIETYRIGQHHSAKCRVERGGGVPSECHPVMSAGSSKP